MQCNLQCNVQLNVKSNLYCDSECEIAVCNCCLEGAVDDWMASCRHRLTKGTLF